MIKKDIFYLNLKSVLKGEEKYVESLYDVISNNKLNKNNFMNLIEEQYHE